MFVNQVDFYTKVKSEDVVEQISSYLDDLRRNGQVIGDEFPIVASAEGYSTYLMVPEEDSLQEQYNNQYITKAQKSLAEIGISHIDVKSLGREAESLSSCQCESRTSYILYSSYSCVAGLPLLCGDCFHYVPLYKVKLPEDELEPHDILCWEKDYQCCDSLQMRCQVGERFGIREISRFDSALTKVGFDICESLKKSTGLPVYYYLYRYNGRSYASEIKRKCPKCDGDWLREEQWHGRFDFECKECLLLSNIAWDVERP
ncbi:DUF2310 family Zn-ribbon-containing protein [Pleionea sp. CnH1-48]|uniref:DUF2310 family Zn-ribbon-containing protein n=1 Tax=Pleionea sp. CnH1-48 TaxID=2954494 RepID=UPI00209797A9|nr:DUF2310 family Zn-ribbon-containing protein [Pleionea sp. CnH1-48]MCO7226181.1 Zn-ribbon-containing protein [Pleionea sp. CnH1-48]